MSTRKKIRVVYLIGAGATQGSIKAVNGSTGLLMRDLAPHLVEEVRTLVTTRNKYKPLANVVNEVVEEDTDFEHIITFFEEASSAVHRDLAEDLRGIFEKVLKRQLDRTKRDLKEDRLALYSALLDMYNVDGIDEHLKGILTLNYDDYIEAAAKALYVDVDFGVDVAGNPNGQVPVLKLHGSFGWYDAWPIRLRRNAARPLWIPPGIRKVKDRYPFNLVWGKAREILDCDVLRVVGCRLGPSDWDLISLLFSARHSNSSGSNGYQVEIIDSPRHAKRLQKEYPYLDVRSVLEIDTYDVGQNLVSEFGGGLRRFRDLTAREAETVIKASESEKESTRNWFQVWLVQMGEGIQRQLGEEATNTPSGAFRKWLGI